MVSSKMEFMVECIKNKEEFKNAIVQDSNVIKAELWGDEVVIMETLLPCDAATSLLERLTGGRVVLQGFGEGGTAVAMMTGENVCGVVRLSGTSNRFEGLIDGTLDGLPPGEHTIQVHATGDLSQGCDSLGPIWEPIGKLGKINVGDNGRASFKFTVPNLEVYQILGRSLAVAAEDETKRFACGIIARSAGLFENSKKICACDGVTLWDERDVPLAGQGRRQQEAEPKQ